MNHKIAFTTAEAHKAETAEVIEAGEAGPRFCNKSYVGLASCERPTGHSDEHRTTGLTGAIIGWGQQPEQVTNAETPEGVGRADLPFLMRLSEKGRKRQIRTCACELAVLGS